MKVVTLSIKNERNDEDSISRKEGTSSRLQDNRFPAWRFFRFTTLQTYFVLELKQ